MPLLFRARGTTRESLIKGAKQKHTQREGLYNLRIRCRGVGQYLLKSLYLLEIIVVYIFIEVEYIYFKLCFSCNYWTCIYLWTLYLLGWI